jgi:Fe-S cluster assembly iron-binding protein IscA
MFSITADAGAHLAQILAGADEPAESDPVIRMVMGKDGLGLQLDSEKPGDTGYEYEGETVLVVDEQLLPMLEDRTLDLETSEQGESLTLR